MKLLATALALLGAAAAVSASPPPQDRDRTIAEGGLPQSLSEYGFFASPRDQVPAAGVTPYRLNTPLWSDGAEKLRFVYIPAGQQAKAQGDGLLDLPIGSALIKSFRFGGKLVETRVLLHRAEGWLALPYVWNEQQTDAQLTLGGRRIELAGPEGKPISYAVPNKNQCKECHGVSGQVTPIGPKAYNLSAAWLTDFAKAGRLDHVPVVAHRIPLWEDRDHVPAADAARGYLEANCAHCHNPNGAASNSGLYLGWLQSDPLALGVGKRPVAAGRGSGTNEFDVVPGDPAHSILYYRMSSLEGGVAMPELGKATLDPAGLAAVQRWIGEMKR